MIEFWKVVKEEPYLTEYRRMAKRTYAMPDGRFANFDIVLGTGNACVLALTSENKVVLAKQYRPGPARVMLDLPGGAVEPDETPLEAIRRELLEETGYTGTFQLIAETVVGAYNTSLRYSFVATNCHKIQAVSPDEHEYIEVVELTLPELRNAIWAGNVTDIGTVYMGMEFLKLLELKLMPE